MAYGQYAVSRHHLVNDNKNKQY